MPRRQIESEALNNEWASTWCSQCDASVLVNTARSETDCVTHVRRPRKVNSERSNTSDQAMSSLFYSAAANVTTAKQLQLPVSGTAGEFSQQGATTLFNNAASRGCSTLTDVCLAEIAENSERQGATSGPMDNASSPPARAKTGVCPQCRRMITYTKSGVLRRHGRNNNCQGSHARLASVPKQPQPAKVAIDLLKQIGAQGPRVSNGGINELFGSPVRSEMFKPKELVPLAAESFANAVMAVVKEPWSCVVWRSLLAWPQHLVECPGARQMTR